MTLDLQRHLIDDHLDEYHPYTVEYRRAGSERYRDFAPHDPRNLSSFEAHAGEMNWSGDRDGLADCLHAALDRYEVHPSVTHNIDRLRDNNAVCIVAGHQPALFGGPLFLALKIMGVIRLCQELSHTSDRPFIPVYWNGSEEHNRGEFGRVTIFDREHDQIHLALPENGKRRMAAETPAKEARTVLAELRKLLPDTEFLPPVLDGIEECAENDLGELQTRLMLRWFGEYGLVVVEPRMLRELAAPTIEKALRDCESMHTHLAADTTAMKEMGYPPQLSLHEPERTTVFYLDEGERFRIRTREGCGYCLERRDRCFRDDAIFQELSEHPERFSPSAALRPIVQGAVLPVVAYVAGGGELAYHVQLRRLYDHFGVDMPLLVPRPAATVLKKSLTKTLDRLELPFDKLLTTEWDWDAVEASAESRGSGQREAFDTFRQHLDSAFDTLGNELQQHGTVNLNDLEQEMKRFLGRIEGLQKRYRQQDPAIGDGPKRQYHRLRKFVLPGERYQELSAWTVYFLALYGREFLDVMLPQINPLTDKHHVFVTG